MGFLAAVMIGLAWIADFVVTAAVLSLFPDAQRIRTSADAVNKSVAIEAGS